MSWSTSPLVWQQYLLNKQRNFESKITNASFRDKEKGWKKFNIKFFSKGCDVYSSGHDSDPYMRLFLSDVILRPSCYSCHFKEGKSGSDITLADFWGIDRIFPDKDDDKGVNLLMINTERGQELMDLVNPKLMTFPVSHEEAVRYNTSWYRSVSPNPKRKRFFKEFRLWRNFDKRTEKLLNNRFSLFDKVRRKAASYIKSLIGNK